MGGGIEGVLKPGNFQIFSSRRAYISGGRRSSKVVGRKGPFRKRASEILLRNSTESISNSWQK
jgi:hypothetical protein